ncbi:MAG: DUF1015 domain-containing protein [Actinobacteria bacterium]|nr:MAG: DUF1015 domain-containing protein [Actinomycetota bacterium]
MADVEPLRALRYDLRVVGSLAEVIAPPYDVIDPAQRERLAARSPFNVVAIDLPQGRDPYETAAEQLQEWRLTGAVVKDPEPALWALRQDYTGPGGDPLTRQGILCRVRVQDYGPGRIRPHERTHPGPKEDRLRLTRATRANLSPIFSLYSDPDLAAWRAIEPALSQAPEGEAVEDDGTQDRLWRIADPDAIAAVQTALADAELLIADGHHRYETARAYAEEVGGEGPHRYVLMCLVAMQDPGLTIFPTHRLVRGLDSGRQEALAEAIRRDFDISEVEQDQLAPPPGPGPLQLGYIDAHFRRCYRLRLRDQSIADRALHEHSGPYRQLDAGVLEALLLKGALGLSDEDIAHLEGFGYARDTDEALELIRRREYDAAFVLRPTPVAQVQAVAESGESMPPKSTYFFPKLPTGLLFNPLE